MQRYLVVVGTLVVVVGLGVAAYFIFFTGSTSIAVAPTGSTSLPVAGNGTPVTQDQNSGSTAGQTTTSSPTTPSPTGTPTTISARLIQISKGPVALGEVVTDSRVVNASSSPEVTVSYIERQSGNVFSYLTQAKTLTRISNKTIPGIESAVWLPNASTTFVRYLSGTDSTTINTYALPATGNGGFFLPQNLSDVAVSSTSVLALTSGTNGSVASLTYTDGTHSTPLFTTALSALRASFAGKNQYLAFTKPSATLPGYAFLIDSKGNFSRLAGPLTGLVALASPLGKWVLVSYVSNGAMQMEVINTATSETLPLPVATIADKCVWTTDDSAIYCGIPVNPPNVSYPSDWYQGAVAFSDRLWKIQVSGRYASLVLDFSKDAKDSLDAEALAIDPLTTTLVFVNKNDGSLWSYSL